MARGDARGKLTKHDLPTPALTLDLDAFESNVRKMAGFVRQRNLAFRPHAKTHKCAEVGKRLIQAGAVGACAAKLSEAEALARGGVTGLLVTSAPVGAHRIERAVRLARAHRDTIFSLDDAGNAAQLNQAAAAARIKLNVAVDLFIGNRTGVAPGQPALRLAQNISKLSHLRLAGIQAYAGQVSHTVGFENRRKGSLEVMGQAAETRRLFEKHGIACPLLTGGSTGTYNIDSEIDGVTELQPGSFIFMDVDYRRIGNAQGPEFSDFTCALTVISTVISRPSPDFAILDAGFKAFSTDRPFTPEPRNLPGATYGWMGDEHGRLNLKDAAAEVRLGDRLEFLVPHCDPTVNLYDVIYVLKGDNVAEIWPISARGRSQ